MCSSDLPGVPPGFCHTTGHWDPSPCSSFPQPHPGHAVHRGRFGQVARVWLHEAADPVARGAVRRMAESAVLLVQFLVLLIMVAFKFKQTQVFLEVLS